MLFTSCLCSSRVLNREIASCFFLEIPGSGLVSPDPAESPRQQAAPAGGRGRLAALRTRHCGPKARPWPGAAQAANRPAGSHRAHSLPGPQPEQAAAAMWLGQQQVPIGRRVDVAELPGHLGDTLRHRARCTSGTSTSPSRPVAIRRVITARLSHTPTSSGCAVAHEQPQSCRVQTRVTRQLSHAARTAGSLASLRNASLVTAAVCSAHSAATPAAASQAAANARTGLSSPPLTTRSSHPGSAATSPLPPCPVGKMAVFTDLRRKLRDPRERLQRKDPRRLRSGIGSSIWMRPLPGESGGGLQPGEGSGAVVFLDVAVVFVWGKVGDDTGNAVGKPAGVGDGKEVFRPCHRLTGA